MSTLVIDAYLKRFNKVGVVSKLTSVLSDMFITNCDIFLLLLITENTEKYNVLKKIL